MSIRAVCVDFGGVLVRTEDRQPRTQAAERLGMRTADLEELIFESDSARRASLGEIPEQAHYQATAQALGVDRRKMAAIIKGFFAGDRVDREFLDLLRSLRPGRKVGLISNAWSGLRDFITRQRFEDVFDDMIISAEVGVVKPDPRIYQLALERLGAKPEEAVFLDDFRRNVEAARSIGMAAIHFTQPEQSLDELKELLRLNR